MSTKKELWAGLLAVFGCIAPSSAQYVISVDMDLITPGIQSTWTANPSDTRTVGLVLSVPAGGVSSYSVSVLFDTGPSEATLNGIPLNVPCGGLTELGPPMISWPSINGFNGATLGSGPASTSCLIATIPLMAGLMPNTDGMVDITVGFLYLPGAFDVLYDNSGISQPVTFNPGYIEIVPEPAFAALLIPAGLLFLRNRQCSLRVSRG